MDRIARQIISLLSGGRASIWEIIDWQDASLPEFFDVLHRLEKDGIIRLRDGMAELTEKGRNIAGKVNVKYKCKECEGTGYREMEEIKEEYVRILKNRPYPVEEYDQGYISTASALRKLAFMMERGDVHGRIFIAGDDDLFSIALALTGMPEKIFVVDIDERLIDYINKVAEEKDLMIEAEAQDLQKDNEKIRKNFDVFVTDPVETLPGIKLFLSRCVASLKGVGCSGYFGLTTLEASRKKWYEIQKMLHEMGFVITDIRRQFQVYPDDGSNFFRYQEKLPIVQKLNIKSDYNWYKSSLYRVEAVKELKPLIEGDVEFGEAVYKDDESWATPV